MDDVDVDCEESGPGSKAWFRFRGSLSCRGRIRLWLHLGCASDFRETVRFNYSVIVRHG